MIIKAGGFPPAQSVEKKLYSYQKWGLGRSPKRGEGGSPTFTPFLGKGGRGIGIENLLYFYKYRLFLQSRQAVFRLLFFNRY